MGFLSGGLNPNPAATGKSGRQINGGPGPNPVMPGAPTPPPQKWGATLHPEPYAFEQAMEHMTGAYPILGLFGGDDLHARIENRKKFFAGNRQLRAQGKPPLTQANYLGQLQGMLP